jgi:hypothetical protein
MGGGLASPGERACRIRLRISLTTNNFYDEFIFQKYYIKLVVRHFLHFIDSPAGCIFSVICSAGEFQMRSPGLASPPPVISPDSLW